LTTTYHFELGTFGTFAPTPNNIADWRAHWKLLDEGNYSLITKLFIGSASLSHDASTGQRTTSIADVAGSAAMFAANEQMYIWAYNDLNRDTNTEWGIFTRTNTTDVSNPDWKLPPGPDLQTSFPFYAFTPDANLALYGGTPNASGSGSHASPTVYFSMQTYGFIPEPSNVLLLGIGSCLPWLKRWRVPRRG
jgi:hypothetical protein